MISSPCRYESPRAANSETSSCLFYSAIHSSIYDYYVWNDFSAYSFSSTRSKCSRNLEIYTEHNMRDFAHYIVYKNMYVKKEKIFSSWFRAIEAVKKKEDNFWFLRTKRVVHDIGRTHVTSLLYCVKRKSWPITSHDFFFISLSLSFPRQTNRIFSFLQISIIITAF